MRRLVAALLGTAMLATSALVAHAATLKVNAGVLQTQSVEFVFVPPVSSEEDCRNDGWNDWVDADGEPFRNQGACVSYVNQGGILYPKSPASNSTALTSISDEQPASDDGLAIEQQQSVVKPDDVPASLGENCVDGGWQYLATADGQLYADAQACVDDQVQYYYDNLLVDGS
jgi:hypothetical protein